MFSWKSGSETAETSLHSLCHQPSTPYDTYSPRASSLGKIDRGLRVMKEVI